MRIEAINPTDTDKRQEQRRLYKKDQPIIEKKK